MVTCRFAIDLKTQYEACCTHLAMHAFITTYYCHERNERTLFIRVRDCLIIKSGMVFQSLSVPEGRFQK